MSVGGVGRPVSEGDRLQGRTGRSYVIQRSDAGKEGAMASVRPAVALGEPSGISTLSSGALVAIKVARRDDGLAREALQREVEMFEVLTASSA